MRRHRRRLATLLIALPLLALMCASATEIDIDIYSEVDCAKNAEVGVILGKTLADLGNNAVTSSATHCDSSERVGRVVVSPSGDNDEELAIAVITRNDDQGLDTCTPATNYQGCIVARRQLRFSPHTALPVRIDLRLACLDKTCAATDTCVAGGCVSATCPPGGCATETVLAPTSSSSADASVADAAAPDSATVSPPITTSDATAGKPCQRVAAATALTPGTITSMLPGAVDIPIGLGTQNHLVFAENDCEYWYFWVDGTNAQLNTATSVDLVNWKIGGVVPLPGLVTTDDTKPVAGANGGNFSVAYRNAPGGVDLFHAIVDQPVPASLNPGQTPTGYPYDVRFTLKDGIPSGATSHALIPPGDGLDLSTPGDCNATDGPSVVFGNDARVYFAAGWYFQNTTQTHCDMDIYVSDDNGAATSTPTYDWIGYWVTTSFTNAHLLLPMPDAGVYGAYPEPEDPKQSMTFDNVAWLTNVANWNGSYDAGKAPAPDAGQIFQPSQTNGTNTATNGANDWNACVKGNSEGHAVRKLDNGLFEASILTNGAWQNDNTFAAHVPPSVQQPSASEIGTGLVLLQNAANGTYGAFTLYDGSVMYVVNGGPASAIPDAWDGDYNAVPGISTATWIAGGGCYADRPVLIWAEAGNDMTVKAMDVSSLLHH